MIATLGPEGTYSHRASLEICDDIVFYDSVHEIADSVSAGDVKGGVVPVENSIEGSVNTTLDVLADYDVYVRKEILVEIHHALISQSERFDEIASHPQALAQCRSFLEAEYPDVHLRSVSSTAKGVEEARENPDVAAVAHPDLASNGLEVVAEEIQDVAANVTRFFYLTTERYDEGDKTTVVVYPGNDRPGLLYDILGVFEERGVNLTRIESRPSKRELGDYVFHIDYEGGYDEEILEGLGDKVDWIKYLGSYDTVRVSG
ncbi:MAG: prephenate dehydratase [Halobacteria archaeon]|nr:prephenate dehydratase [Halobacteria archaeon]